MDKRRTTVRRLCGVRLWRPTRCCLCNFIKMVFHVTMPRFRTKRRRRVNMHGAFSAQSDPKCRKNTDTTWRFSDESGKEGGSKGGEDEELCGVGRARGRRQSSSVVVVVVVVVSIRSLQSTPLSVFAVYSRRRCQSSQFAVAFVVSLRSLQSPSFAVFVSLRSLRSRRRCQKVVRHTESCNRCTRARGTVCTRVGHSMVYSSNLQ